MDSKCVFFELTNVTSQPIQGIAPHTCRIVTLEGMQSFSSAIAQNALFVRPLPLLRISDFQRIMGDAFDKIYHTPSFTKGCDNS